MKKLLYTFAFLALSSCANNLGTSNDIGRRLDELERQFQVLKQNLDLTLNTVTQLQFSQGNQDSLIASLQTQANSQQILLTQLQTQESIVQIKDVCGTYPGVYNEVMLKTKSGKYIAYFEQHGNRFLVQLTPGSYKTTDSTNCYFTINSNGELVNEHY
jgi:hypothetical protein